MNLGLTLTLLVGLFIILGTVIGRFLKNNHNVLDFSICLSFGVLVTLSILELLPEIIEHIVEPLKFRGALIALIGVLIGFGMLTILDEFVPHHEENDSKHHHKDSNCLNEHLKHIGIVTSLALILHNIIEGMSLYIATLDDYKVGLLLCIGIGLHNLPMGFVIESTLRNEYKFNKIIIISLIVSLSTLLGGFIALSLSASKLLMGLLLSTTLGMLLYIAFVELLPQITRIKNTKIKYIGVLSGVIILLISLIFG